MNITSQNIMDKHNKALTRALADNDGKPKRAYAGVYYVAYGGYVTLIEETTRYGQVVWDNRITTTLGRDNETLLYILMDKPDDTHSTLKDSVSEFLRYVEYMNDTKEDTTMTEQTDTYDIEQLQGYYVGYAGKQSFYGKTRNEVVEKLNAYYAPSENITIKHTDNEDIETSIQELLVKRDEYVKAHYGHESFDLFREYRFNLSEQKSTSKRAYKLIQEIDSDNGLNDIAVQLSDLRKQQSKGKRDNKALLQWEKKSLTRAYGEPAPLFYEYPKNKRPNVLPCQTMKDRELKRVIVFSSETKRRSMVRYFYTRDYSMSMFGLNQLASMFYVMNGYNGVITKLPLSKSAIKRIDHLGGKHDYVETQTDSTLLPDNRPLTPQTRKQRKASKRMNHLTDYQIQDKHSDIITVGEVTKEYTCTTAKDKSRNIIFTPNGNKIYETSLPAYKWVAKQLGCDTSVIPSHLGRMVNFTYNGIHVTVKQNVTSK